MEKNELCHHGVLGMKWGVRRYQNKDGSLTSKGKARFAEVSTSNRESSRDTKRAIKVLSKSSQRAMTNVDVNKRLASRSVDKSNKLISKAEKQNSEKAYNKYFSKAKSNTEKARSYLSNAKKWAEASKAFDKKLDAISSGKMKAGRDFIVQRDYETWGLPGVIGGVNVRDTVVERSKK